MDKANKNREQYDPILNTPEKVNEMEKILIMLQKINEKLDRITILDNKIDECIKEFKRSK